MNQKKILNSIELALEHHRAGQIEEAARIYADVCRAAPRFFDAWYLAGALAFQRGGHLPEAVELLSRALRLKPNSAEAKLFLGMALADAGRFVEAEKWLKSATQKLPGFPEAWENLANAVCALGRPVEAIECLRRVLVLQPNRDDVRRRIDELFAACESSKLAESVVHAA